MAVIMTSPYQQFFDDNGNPLSGGKIYTYRAGTSQLKNSFTDSTENIPAPNPIILDAAGRAVVWISGSYKFVITDADDNIIRTVDNVTSFNVLQDGANSYFESLSGDGVQTTFSLSQDLGTDENAVFVFIDNGLTNHARNGSFDSDTIWTKGAGWSIGSGVATATGAISTAISQTSNITLVPGQAYVVEMTMTRSAGTLAASVGGTAGTARSASGTYSEIIIAGSTQELAFTGAGFTGTLDNVRIIPVMSSGANFVAPTQYTLNGESITFASPPGDGTNNISISAPSLLVASAAGSAAAAEQSADNAATSEMNAAQSASDASDSADLAESWAIGDIAARPEGSAKVWADAASEMVIPAGSITLSKLADIPANTFIGNATGSAATPQALSVANYLATKEIIGLTISNNGVSPNTVLDFEAGRCWSSDQTTNMIVASGGSIDITDSADGNDGGSIGTSDSVYFYAVGDTTGSNATTVKWSDTRSPTFTGYDRMRYIGSRRTDGSSNLIAMTQDGDTVRYDLVQTSYDSTVGTTAANYPVLTPADARVKSFLTVVLERGGGGSVAAWIYEKGTVVPAPSSTNLSANISSQSGNRPSGNIEVMSSDGEVAAIAEVALDMRIFSLGWEDFDRKRFV